MKGDNKIWGCLLHLSFTMWEQFISPHRPFRGYRANLELDVSLWNDAICLMAERGINMVVIDLGDAVKYDTHPEIAVNNAWSVDHLRQEIKRIKSLGIEPIPKLNFSAGHDTWMGEYSKMVSTEDYYRVCADLIKEVCDIFEHPRYFHLGMDEESAEHQSTYRYIVVRKNDAWWNDFYFLVNEVEKNGSKAWIWSDYMLWNDPESFFSKMPKSVVQSNWYYGEVLDINNKYVKKYIDLEEKGYEQIPTGSYHDYNVGSIGATVDFAKKHIADLRLLGFLQTFWRPTIEENRDRILQGIELLGRAKQSFVDR